MRVTKYVVVLNDNGLPELVKDSCHIYQGQPLDCPQAVVNMLNDLYKLNQMAEEYLYLISTHSKQIKGVFEVSHGGAMCTYAEPREILLRALLSGATGMILVHNHPSGDPSPSQDDLKATKRIWEAGALLGIPLLDHIIIGPDSDISLKQTGVIR